MSKALNGNFTTKEQARNVKDDLIAMGFPQENIYIEEQENIIRVMIPSEERREVEEVFDRHRVTY
ncbi:SPOR domain-containing protein [Marinobacter sp. ATCH36]|uniref:SPOR domain-containing protein n=1 Tax=Marinobacter sp. ATCH36 TaxID=2945106 RepID=UPI002020EE4D|nr:SPOR domain-containing protein [Marinobacter sp. ATCH36]MCL7944196.1 SPOR domain-containing protein [Marinobacter sp. ATCH36]